MVYGIGTRRPRRYNKPLDRCKHQTPPLVFILLVECDLHHDVVVHNVNGALCAIFLVGSCWSLILGSALRAPHRVLKPKKKLFKI